MSTFRNKWHRHYVCGRAIALGGGKPFATGNTLGSQCILLGWRITRLELVIRKRFQKPETSWDMKLFQ
jgi:hypothetical protein